MDRATVLGLLAKAEGYVIDDELKINRLRAVVVGLRRDGAAGSERAKTARGLLRWVEFNKRTHIAYRDRLRSLVKRVDAERTINSVRYNASVKAVGA
jgi:hypothetical protein